MIKRLLLIVSMGLFPVLALAANSAHQDPLTKVIFWVTLIFLLAIMGQYLAKRLKLPGVLGELLMGILIGNIGYYYHWPLMIVLREGSAVFNIMQQLLTGTPLVKAVSNHLSVHYARQLEAIFSADQGMHWLYVSYILDIFSRYGVLFLLFIAGLESSIHELVKTGRYAIQVACIGVIAPIILGFLVTYEWFNYTFQTNLFIAATLSATSIGITACVLKELNKLNSLAGQTILGAAMLDDILGLIILAMITTLVTHHQLEGITLLCIIVKAVLFFGVIILWGGRLARNLIRLFNFLEALQAKLISSFIILMSLSWLAATLELTPIMGAFAAGLIIRENFFKKTLQSVDVKDLMMPLEVLFAPLFFILVGLQVKLEAFARMEVVVLALVLTLVAIAGKLLSGLGAPKGERLAVGIGMLPRGEVGLIFASVGRNLQVIPEALFSAIVLMIVTTTLITPWLLYKLMNKHDKKSRRCFPS